MHAHVLVFSIFIAIKLENRITYAKARKMWVLMVHCNRVSATTKKETKKKAAVDIDRIGRSVFEGYGVLFFFFLVDVLCSE